MVPPEAAHELQQLSAQIVIAGEGCKTNFAIMIPRLVKLNRPKPLTSSCLWPNAASSRIASTSTFSVPGALLDSSTIFISNDGLKCAFLRAEKKERRERKMKRIRGSNKDPYNHVAADHFNERG